MVTRRQVMKTLALGSAVLGADFMQGLSFAQQCTTQSVDPGLDSAFKIAQQQFMARDATIGGLLDQNVTVFSVKDKTRYNGISDVEGFFTKDFKDNPSFTPNAGYQAFSNGKRGIIIGTACWNDKNGPETIGFVFIWVNQGGKWMIKRLYAD